MTDLVAEYNSSGAVLRRCVHGAGMDEPLVWYEGSGTTDRRYLHADERGSIVAISNNSGAGIESFKYSSDGEAANAANSRFGYTGQVWLAEVGLYYYKSRMYSPKLGRFLQPDAIGYGGGMNLYAYVGGDPINRVDPLGFQEEEIMEEVIFTYKRPRFYDTFERDLYFLDLIFEDHRSSEESSHRSERPTAQYASIDAAEVNPGTTLKPGVGSLDLQVPAGTYVLRLDVALSEQSILDKIIQAIRLTGGKIDIRAEIVADTATGLRGTTIRIKEDASRVGLTAGYITGPASVSIGLQNAGDSAVLIWARALARE